MGRDQQLADFFGVWLETVAWAMDTLSASGLRVWRADNHLWYWEWDTDAASFGLQELGECVKDAVAVHFAMDKAAIDAASLP